MDSRNFKKLAPAPARPGTEPHVSLPAQGARRNITRNACSPCKNKKAKCDGNRPECGRCQKNGDTCLYEVNRRDIAKLQLISDSDAARLQSLDIVFAVLQSGTDVQVAELLAQIRLGETPEALASAFNLPGFHQPNPVPYETSAVLPNAGPSTTYDDPKDPSTRESHGFFDLHEQYDWSHSTETTITYHNQITDGERDDFVPDSTQVAHNYHKPPY
ncbi:hypothetical protein F4805DRAFT_333085 [Annulohypoxylon moriforme]|nr:hypothetical protein F4805DRAFT_333085 [Annulohypoxylon moriforme]